MKKKADVEHRIKGDSNYLTTSELARLCGVSRFTIINWVNQRKIKAVKTAGKHRRIPLREAISFLETVAGDTERLGLRSNLAVPCWKYAEGKKSGKNCRNCLIYKRQIDYCFLLVRELGKEVICCEGNCSECDYFNDFFAKRTRAQMRSDKRTHISKTNGEKEDLLNTLSYRLGVHIRKLRRSAKL